MGSRSIVIVAVLVASVVLLLAGLAAYRTSLSLADASEAVHGTARAQVVLADVLGFLSRAESGQRGYLLTRNPEYLMSYEQARAQIEARLGELAGLVSGDAAAHRSYEELRALVQVKTDALTRTLESARGDTSGQAADAVPSEAGRFAMEQINAMTARMRNDQARALEQQLDAERRARTSAGRSAIVLTALAITMLLALALLVRRDTARRRVREQLLATTLRSVGDAVIATDERGIVSITNAAAESLTGWRSSEATGRPLEEVFRIIDEASRETVLSPAAKLQDGRVERVTGQTLLIRRNGVETPIAYSAAPIFDETTNRRAEDLDAILGVVLVFRDATETRAQEQALRDADRRKNEFLAVLAHELRNPLAPIRQAAQIARSASASPAQIGWSTEVIERQVGRMARLLDDLLDVSRITRGTLEVRRSRVELASVIEAAVEMARPLIDARRHTLTLDVSSEPLLLDADPLRIAQVIGNLLTNASKYTSSGGRISLSAARAGDFAEVRIADNGAGLSREAISTIFQMFVQISSPLDREEGGLGVGLALSKGLVELHGGTIEASSPGPGHGSEFIVRLPLARERRENVAKPSLKLASARSGLRLVVADDNHDAAASLAALLELEGYKVETVHDGAAALELIQRSRPDIALLDIGMPGLNGYDVAKQVRAADWGAGITLVAVTGWGQETDKDRAFEAGFDHHWVKPVAPSTAIELCKTTAARRIH